MKIIIFYAHFYARSSMPVNSNKRVFLTGATGFIGSRVAEILCINGWEVLALVRSIPKANSLLDTWDTHTPRTVNFVAGDLFAGSPSDRMQLFMKCVQDANAVVHLAEVKAREHLFAEKNIKTLGLLLEAAQNTPTVQRFVFVSAFMAGGLPQPLPEVLTEDVTGVEFPDPYYQWKRMGERLVIRAAKNSHFSYSIVRPALVYGPRAEWLTVMLKLIRAAGRFLIPLPDGGRARLGTVHVEDAAATIALSSNSEQARNQIIHAVDSGRTTYADWFAEIAKNTGWETKIVGIPNGVISLLGKGADALTSIAGIHYGAYLWAQILGQGCGYSNEKMKSICGSLRYPSLMEGIPTMMKWFLETHP